MKKIKALFFDVDGTLYTHRVHDFPQSTQYTLHKLKENGYKVDFATSRCRFETSNLPRFFREFAFDACIYDGGALVMEGNEVFEESPMQTDEIQKLLDYTKKEKIAVRYSTFADDCIAHYGDARILDEFFKLYLNMPIEKPYENEKVYNMLAYPSEQRQAEEIKQLLQESFIVEHSRHTLEITARDIDKSKGIAHLCEKWNVAMQDIICFGDGANDVNMLKAAGVGVAMGNANPKALTAADVVCGHIDEDGLYHFCKEHNLI